MALLIDTPEITPARYGLASVSTLVNDPSLRWTGGVEWIPNPTPGATVTQVDVCDVADLIADHTDLDTLTGVPLHVTAAFETASVGLSADEIHNRARLALALSEQPAVEAAVWPLIVDDATTPAGATAVSLLAGVGALERWLWESYGGLGVLHVARQIVPHLVAVDWVKLDGDRLVTKLGTLVSAGAYPVTGPDKAAAGVGNAWIAATGAVNLRMSEVRVPGENGSAWFAPLTNDALGVAERTILATWERAAAVKVTLEPAPTDN